MVSYHADLCHCCFFFNDTATTEIYTLSLHDALPISGAVHQRLAGVRGGQGPEPLARRGREEDCGHLSRLPGRGAVRPRRRSEEHTSELQSRQYLVCRLLLEKKKQHTFCVEQQHSIHT